MAARGLTDDAKLKLGLAACAHIAEGASASSACSQAGLSWQALWEWKSGTADWQKTLADAYARAREMRTEQDVEQLQRVSDGTDALGDLAEQLTEMEAGDVDPDKRDAYLAAFTSNRIQRDRLRVDTLKWLASKRMPKVYGDKVEQSVSGGITVEVVRK